MKKKLLFALPVLALALSSCSFLPAPTSSSSSSSASIPSTSSFVPVKYDSLYENYTKHAIYEQSSIPTSVKETNFLVIPVWFSDSESYVREDKDVIRDRIQKAFFGTTEETGWNSVKTYYETESHGKKTINGVVSPWYESNKRVEHYAGSNDERERTRDLVIDAVNWYFTNNPEVDRTTYDMDGDGYLDALSIIYAAPDYNTRPYGGGTNFWAYVDWVADAHYKNPSRPGPCAYLWASYDFSYRDTTHCEIDTHTYIHETGHLFGLEDYYDYTPGSNDNPAGGFSMQDFNVGGHDPYSVIGLGWGNVNVPEETGSYTLRPFESSGDVILLANSYSNSVFDEYLLLEYYTPTGLNKFDTDHRYYSNTNPKGVDRAGIRLWHVDSRLIYRTQGGWNETGITTEITNEHEYRLLCTNNSPTNDPNVDTSPLSGRGNYARYRLLQLVRKMDRHLPMPSSGLFKAADLFYQGETFSMEDYSSSFVERGRLNSGKALGWSFSVDAINEDGAVITVTKA